MFKKFVKTGVMTALIIAVIAPVLFIAPTVHAQDSTTPEDQVITNEETDQAPSPVGSPTADIQGSLCAGANLDVTTDCQSGVTDRTATDDINKLVGDIINIFSWVVGVVSVIMIIYGGLRYITSGGDSGNVSNAKNTILYAIIGLIIVALSQTIVRFVLGRVINV